MDKKDSTDQAIGDLPSNKPVVHSETLRLACSQLLDMYIDEEYFKLGHEVGTRLHWGELEAMGVLNDVPDEYQIVDTPGTDIFGNPLSKQYNFQCECPKCHRTLAASRFTLHLERCMGMGRTGSRTASPRLAAAPISVNKNNKKSNNASNDSSKNAGQESSSSGSIQKPLNGELGSEDNQNGGKDDDEDRSIERKKKTKQSIDKVALKRKGPLSRVKNTDVVGAERKRDISPDITDLPKVLGAAKTSI